VHGTVFHSAGKQNSPSDVFSDFVSPVGSPNNTSRTRNAYSETLHGDGDANELTPQDLKPRRTPEGLRQVLHNLGLRPDVPIFDLHGSDKITSKCIDPRPEDLILHLPKGSRTRKQCIEVLNHPKTVAKCKWAKAQKKDKHRVAKCTERNRYEQFVKKSGGTVGQACKRGTHYCAEAYDVTRRSDSRKEYNSFRTFFRLLVNQTPTTYLPPPSFHGMFRQGADGLAYQFTNIQLLPTVHISYTETSYHRYSELACTWAGNLSDWERDFDLQFALKGGETLRAQLQCKGFGHWYKPLYKTLASSDYARAESSAPFLSFYQTFRRMAVFAIRHLVNRLQFDYQSTGTALPLLYASYSSLKRWLGEGLRLESAEALLDLYEAETEAFWTRFQKLFMAVFPREWEILAKTYYRTRARCAARREKALPITANDVASHFALLLSEVKEEEGYLNDREMCRARFNQLVKEVNARASSSRMTREQALYHMLPRKPRQETFAH